MQAPAKEASLHDGLPDRKADNFPDSLEGNMRFVRAAVGCCFSRVALAQDLVVIRPATDHIVATYRLDGLTFRPTFNTPRPTEAHILSADPDANLDATGVSLAEPRAATL